MWSFHTLPSSITLTIFCKTSKKPKKTPRKLKISTDLGSMVYGTQMFSGENMFGM